MGDPVSTPVEPKYLPTIERLHDLWMGQMPFVGFIDRNEYEVGFDQWLETIAPFAPGDDRGLSVAVGRVLANASNYPKEVTPHVLGRDMAPLIRRVVDSILGLATPTSRKSAAERENINVRVLMRPTATRGNKLDKLMALQDAGHVLERGTLDAFGQSENERGFSTGWKSNGG